MKLLLRPQYYWLFIFAITFIAYQLVQDNIRPNFDGDNFVIKYLLGIAPNFFPGIGIPSLFVVLIPEISKNLKNKHWVLLHKHIIANVISMIGLLTWEFLQPITTKGRFDWNDVLWTIIGALVFQIIWSVSPSKYKEFTEFA